MSSTRCRTQCVSVTDCRDLILSRPIGISDAGGQLCATVHAPPDRVETVQMVVVGTDIPDVTASTLRDALDALDRHEAVVGPAHDGGYYLLGLRQPAAALFEGIEWSTGSVLRDTLERAARAHISMAPIATLPTLQDIDDIQVRSADPGSRSGH